MKSLTRFNSLFFTTGFCLFLVSPCLLGVVNSAAAAENYPDRLELLAMAKNGQIAELDALLSGYGANDYHIRDARGRLNLYQLNDPAKAIEDLTIATQLRPSSTHSLYHYASVLYRSHDCRAVKALRKFRKTCRKGMPACQNKYLTWARGAIKNLTTTGGCVK